jgi:glutathione synthase/RimK-type ligase-like ATP-grasp enzyme
MTTSRPILLVLGTPPPYGGGEIRAGIVKEHFKNDPGFRMFSYSRPLGSKSTQGRMTVRNLFFGFVYIGKCCGLMVRYRPSVIFFSLPVLYTSSEDDGGHYRDYIEDVLWNLQERGARLIPPLKYFRAHHNKVFMELLRGQIPLEGARTIQTRHFGTLEDLKRHIGELPFPCVIKKAAGAGSRGVALARTPEEMLKAAARFSRTKNIPQEIIDHGRSVKHHGYVRESLYRSKFIVQTFISGLSNDWKILVYGEKYYVLYRKNRPNDFRASGSGLLEYQQELPAGMLDFAKSIYEALDVPHVSLDIAYDGETFHLIELQAVRFGTHTLDTSPFYFVKQAEQWRAVDGKSVLEEEYAASVAQFLERQAKGVV